MKRIGGTFNGTGATVYLCIGFIPDWVRLWNCEGTQRILLEWNIGMMRAAEIAGGIQLTAADQTAAACTTAAGIRPYYGGTPLTSTDAGTVTYAEGVYLKKDPITDYRQYSANNPAGYGDAVAVDINTWTLDTSANRTGHFNEDVNGTYIGEGSLIWIDGKVYAIEAVTAGQGEATDEVTLSVAAPSGVVERISGMYDFKPMIEGETPSHGFALFNTTVNVNNAICCFEAGTWA